MGSPKTLTKYGALAKIESAYGTYATMAGATDGLDIIEPPKVDIAYVHQGERAGKSPATRGGRPRVGRMARSGSGSLVFEGAGGGAPYSASIKPNVHTMMRASGFDATLTATGGSEKYVYTPCDVGAEVSVSVEAYYRGQKYPLAGVYSNFNLTSDTPGLPKFSFPFQGLFDALPSDASVPSITYTDVFPMKAEATLMTAIIGADTFTVGKIKSLSVDIERNISARALDNTTGKHGGFNVGVERVITMSTMIEAEALLPVTSPYLGVTGFHIFNLMEQCPEMALHFELGGTQYFRMKFDAAQAQLIEAPEQEDGAASMWQLKWKLNPSILTANDECLFTFD